MFRQFYIENSLGKKYQLTNRNFKHFLNEPQGLGYTKSLTTLRLGNQELKTNEQLSMPSISGTLLFYDKLNNAYQDYIDFIQFARYTPLKLYYQPPNLLAPYYIDCELIQLDKDEYSREGYLSCGVQFYGTSLWKNSQSYEYEIGNITDEGGKYYDLARPYYYAGNSLNSIIINNNGDVPVGFTFEINGSVTNPRLTAVQNETTYGLLKLNGTFDYCKIDSSDVAQSIYLENEDSVIANPLSYQDLSVADGIANITFFKLKVGQSDLSFSCDKISAFSGTIKFSWKDERMSI